MDHLQITIQEFINLLTIYYNEPDQERQKYFYAQASCLERLLKLFGMTEQSIQDIVTKVLSLRK